MTLYERNADRITTVRYSKPRVWDVLAKDGGEVVGEIRERKHRGGGSLFWVGDNSTSSFNDAWDLADSIYRRQLEGAS